MGYFNTENTCQAGLKVLRIVMRKKRK